MVAEAIGIGSGKQYEKAKYIHNNADKETIKQLNEEKISIHKAWTVTKKRLEDELKESEQARIQAEGSDIDYYY